MGKTTRWFRALLGGNKKEKDSSSSKKKGWGFVKSFRDKDPPPHHQTPPGSSYRQEPSSSTYFEGGDPNKHAIAVAAATAAVAEAAVAAAQAAAAVVKLTSSGRSTSTAHVSSSEIRRDFWAAVKIQSAFRGYLARRALKALKGLVKLQALVRGHIIRKKTAEQMRRMQALVRVQSRARASRVPTPEARHPNIKPPTSHHPGPATPEKYERKIRSNSTRHERTSTLKRNSSRSSNRDVFDWDHYKGTPTKYGSTDDEKIDKILEIDPGKPQSNPRHRNLSHTSQQQVVLDHSNLLDSPSKDSTTAQQSCSSPSSGEVQSRNTRRLHHSIDDEAFCTAENSPQFNSATSVHGSSRRGPFTPTGSDCSRSFVSVYSDYPNYMSNTESSQAKVRSQSAPRQRLEFEKSSSARRYNVNGFQGFGDTRSTAQRASSTLRSSFSSKAYPGSGRLDRLGMPIQNESVSFSGVYPSRYD